MTLNDSLAHIKNFNPIHALLLKTTGLKTNGQAALVALEQGARQENYAFPPEFRQYIQTVCPEKALNIQGVGNPITLLSLKELSWKMTGFFNNTGNCAANDTNNDNDKPESNPRSAGWDESWFLIAREGGDPIIVNLNDTMHFSPVYSALSTEGAWEFTRIADSIAQYLLCATALEYAMHFPGIDDPLDDDFNLAAPAAAWLFPFILLHAESYYEEWVSVFENYTSLY